MTLHLPSNIERFIQEQVQSGNFPTPQAVIEASLSLMMNDEVVLTHEELAGIKHSDEQINRGEAVDFDEFAARMRKKYGIASNGRS